MGFVEDVLKYTQRSESPRRFYYWSGLASISAVVKNRVWLVRQGGQLILFPNIYVLLVARSGLRKGPPVNLARALVTAVDNTKVIEGRTSIEAIIEEIRENQTKPNGGPPELDSTAFLVASEFASFIISDPNAMTQLTDLYDGHYHPSWTYRTRGHGKEVLKSPCITLLGASNEVHLRDALPENAIGGGFLARTAVIFADQKSHSDSGVRDQTNDFPKNFIKMRDRLTEISKVKGPFTWKPDALDFYDEWYQKFDQQDHSEDQTGTLERFHDSVLKIAMLLSLSNKLDKVIELSDIQEALVTCEAYVPGSRRVGMGQGSKSASAPATAVFIKALVIHPEHRMRRSTMLQRHWEYFDSFELDKIAESLQAQKAIKISMERDPDDDKTELVYILNPKIVERYQSQKKEEAT